MEACLKAFLTSREADGCSPATLRSYEKGCSLFVDFLDGREPTPELMDEFKLTLNGGSLKPASVNTYLRAIRALLIFCHERGYIKRLIKVKLVRYQKDEPRILSREEVTKLLKACEGNKFLRRRDRLIVIVLANTGVRRSEITSLRWSDIDLETKFLTVRDTKNNEVRKIPLKQPVIDELIAWRDHRFNTIPNGSDDLIFNIKHEGVRSSMKKVAERAGVEFTPHDLRRFFATECVRSGIGVYALMRLLGHKKIETTLRYVRMTYEDVLQEFDKFEGIF
jgi:integrase